MSNIKRRQFLTKAGVAAGAAAGTALAAPPAIAQEPIRWRMQTYAGARLAST
jgi:phosphodiesterase/alkaline phosphatase D-like protein